MGKYVIESKFENTRCFLEVACENREPYFFINRVDSLTPYTEPEPHAEVTADAYQRGYEAGLNDAWEAARKIVLPGDVSGIYLADLEEIFDRSSLQDVIKDYSASECIEKIRQYEQAQEEIKVGDEVELKCGVRPAIYMQGTKGSDEIYLLFNDGSCGLHSKSEIERKTGRHFPEIAEVLEKMRGE